MALSTFDSSHAGINLNIGNATTPVFTSDFDGFASDAFTLQFSLTDAQASEGQSSGYTPYTSYLETEGFDFSGFSFGFNSDANQFEFHTTDNDTLTFDASGLSMSDGAPHHFALSLDKDLGQINLHVDGASVGSQSLPNALSLFGGGDLVFGQSLSDFTSGSFDNPALSEPAGAAVLQDIAVYNDVRSDADIALDAKFGESSPVTNPTLSHQWDMITATTGALADTVSGTVATINPTAVVTGSLAATLPDTGVEINTQSSTNSEMVMIENFTGFAGTPFTMQVDFASTAQLSDESFIGLVSYAEEDYDNSLLIGMRDGESFQVFAEDIGFVQFDYDLNSLMDGGQHTLSVVADPDARTFTLYVDGRSLGTKEFNGELSIEGGGTLVFGQEQDRLGGGFDADQAFEGVITEARVFNEMRSEEDIVADALSPDDRLATDVNLTDHLGNTVSASASSSGWGGTADQLIDNVDTGRNWAHTYNRDDEWVEIDLKDEYDVTSIQVTNRNDSSQQVQARLNGAEVVVLDGDRNEIHRFDPITDADGTEKFTFDLPDNIDAQYIRVEHSNQYLNISEIDVFGTIVEPKDGLTSAWNFEPQEQGAVLDIIGDSHGMALTEALGTTNSAPELPDYGRGLTLNTGENAGQSAAVAGFDGFTSDSFTFEMSFASVMNIGDEYNALVSYAETNFDNAFTLGTNHGGNVLQVHARSIGTVNFETDAWNLMDGEEHSIALSVNNDTLEMSIYIDGALVGTETMTEALTVQGGGTLVFGQEQDLVGGGFDPDQEFQGTYFDAALFQDVRTATEIASDHENGLNGSEDALYANWEFSTDGVVDSVGAQNGNVDLQGDISVSVTNLTGGIALNSETTDQRLEVQNFTGFEGDQTTIEIGFSSTMDLNGGFKPLLSYSEPGFDNALTVGFTAGGTGLQIHMKGADPITFGLDAKDLMDGLPHEITLTMDETVGEIGLFVDGYFIGRQEMDNVDLDGNGILIFGQEQDSFGGGFSNDQVFEGTMHEVRVFDEARSTEEVYSDAKDGVDSVSEPNLVAHWDMRLDRDFTVDDLVGSQSLQAVNIDQLPDAAPEFGETAYADLTEGAGEGTVVATVSAADQNWDAISYRLNDDHDGMFVIDAQTGDITVAQGRSLDADDQENYTVEVEALENGVSVGTVQTLDISVGDVQETINVGSDAYTDHGDAGDTLIGSAADDNQITGDTGNNIIIGDQGAANFDAGGNDILAGGDGSDEIYGQGGNDVISGGVGNDYIEGNRGDDFIYGGEGVDTARFYGNISDFEIAYDAQSGNISITDLNTVDGNEGVDIVNGIENFIFDHNGEEASFSLDNMITKSALGSNAATKSTNDGLALHVDSDTNYVIETGSGDFINLIYNGGVVKEDTINNWEAIGVSENSNGSFEILWKTDDNTTFSSWTVDAAGNHETDRGISASDEAAVKALENEFGLDLNDDGLSSNILTSDWSITGAGGDDVIQGTNANNLVYSRDGDDVISTGGGNDRISSGAGDDIVNAGSGNDIIYGSSGNDTLDGGSGSDRVDYQNSDTGVEVNLEEGSGSGGDAQGDQLKNIESIYATQHDDVLIGSNSNNTLYSRDGDDIMDGGGGNDHLYGHAGDDTIQGGIGNDYINGGSGADTIDGGSGFDKIDYQHSEEGVTVNLADQTVSGGDADGDIISNIEGAYGSNNQDMMIGSSEADYLHGRNGDDVINADGGNDQILGGSGNDNLTGGAGRDTINGGAGNDIINGDSAPTVNYENLLINGSFEDTSNGTGSNVTPPGWDVVGNGFGVYRYGGGRGTDGNYSMPLGGWSSGTTAGISQTLETVPGQTYTLSFDAGITHGTEGSLAIDVISNGVSILSELIAETAATKGMETYRFTFEATDDSTTLAFTLPETQANRGMDFDIDAVGIYEGDVIPQANGNDKLYGGDGDDVIFGGGGNDYIRGQGGADTIDGGEGIDKIDYYESGAGVTINLEDQTVSGGDAEGDTITSIEQALGSNHDDVLTGSDDANYLHGRNGNDVIDGGAGNDSLYGGYGDDILAGGSGKNSLEGNQGSDVFEISGAIDETGTRLYGGDRYGRQNDASWTDTVSMDMQNVAELLYGAGDIDRNDGYLELTNGDMTISIEAAGAELDFNIDELTGIASVSLDTNTDALLKVDVDNDGTFDTTYNLYDIENISLG